jgi:hypothetical protein
VLEKRQQMRRGDVAELTDAFAVKPDLDKRTLDTVLESADRLVKAD